MLNVKDIKKLHAIFENENVEEIEIRNGESSLRLTLGADAPKAQSRAPECAPVAAAAVSETPAPVSNESELHSKWIGFFTRLNPKNGENYIKLRDMVKKGEVVTAHDLVESGAAWVIAYEDGTLHRNGEELELLEDKAPTALVRADMRDNLVVIAEGGQGPDHPVHPAIPETNYLKAFFCAVSASL